MIVIPIAVVLLAMAMILVRLIAGPAAYDRILAVNLLGTCTVVMIVLLGTFKGSSSFVDIALIYGLINFITTFALLRYFQMEEKEHF